MAASIDRQPDDTPRQYRPQGMRHDGRCGVREQCWRAECRDAFGVYATVERFDDGTVLARCHGGRFNVLGMRQVAA